MKPGMAIRHTFSTAAAIAVLAVACFVAGKVGLKVGFVNQYATTLSPTAGIALAALLLWGYRLWPGILVGGFLAHVTSADGATFPGMLASLGIATGSTLQGLLGAWLVNRFASGPRAFDRAHDVFAFTALAAMVSTAVGATFSVTSLSLAGLAGGADPFSIWLTRWIGHAAGDLIFAPPVILWALDLRLRWSRARAIEAGVLLLSACILALSAFTDVLPPEPSHLGLAFLCMPTLLWAAFRFGQRETATAMLVISGIAVWGVFRGLQVAGLSPANVTLELQAYLGITSVAVLAIAAEVSQRRQNVEELELQAERLRQQAQLLDLAPVLVRDMDDRIILWNSGAERLYGFTQPEALGKRDAAPGAARADPHPTT